MYIVHTLRKISRTGVTDIIYIKIYRHRETEK